MNGAYWARQVAWFPPFDKTPTWYTFVACCASAVSGAATVRARNWISAGVQAAARKRILGLRMWRRRADALSWADSSPFAGPTVIRSPRRLAGALTEESPVRGLWQS